LVVVGGTDNVGLLELETAKMCWSINWLHGDIAAIAVAFDKERLFIGTSAGAVWMCDLKTGKPLCRIFGFCDGAWAVIDDDGRYDASKNAKNQSLHWVIGTEVVGVDQLKDASFDSGLLAKYLGTNHEPLRQKGRRGHSLR
jgi:hypothetical protein